MFYLEHPKRSQFGPERNVSFMLLSPSLFLAQNGISLSQQLLHHQILAEEISSFSISLSPWQLPHTKCHNGDEDVAHTQLPLTTQLYLNYNELNALRNLLTKP